MIKICSLEFLNRNSFDADIMLADGTVLFSIGSEITPEILLRLYYKDIYIAKRGYKEAKTDEIEPETFADNADEIEAGSDLETVANAGVQNAEGVDFETAVEEVVEIEDEVKAEAQNEDGVDLKTADADEAEIADIEAVVRAEEQNAEGVDLQAIIRDKAEEEDAASSKAGVNNTRTGTTANEETAEGVELKAVAKAEAEAQALAELKAVERAENQLSDGVELKAVNELEAEEETDSELKTAARLQSGAKIGAGAKATASTRATAGVGAASSTTSGTTTGSTTETGAETTLEPEAETTETTEAGVEAAAETDLNIEPKTNASEGFSKKKNSHYSPPPSAKSEVEKSPNDPLEFDEEQGQRVAELSVRLGKILSIDSAQLLELEKAAYYHNIGRTKLKQADLEDKDFKKKQALAGQAFLLNEMNLSPKIAEAARFYNKNYQSGQTNLNSPGFSNLPYSHIVAITNYYDELINKNMSKNAVLRKMLQLGGNKFNIFILHKFINMVRKSDE